MTVAEALAAGTPAIVTKGAPWRGLESEAAGWGIEVGVDPLVACLEQALALPDATLAQMGPQRACLDGARLLVAIDHHPDERGVSPAVQRSRAPRVRAHRLTISG